MSDVPNSRPQPDAGPPPAQPTTSPPQATPPDRQSFGEQVNQSVDAAQDRITRAGQDAEREFNQAAEEAKSRVQVAAQKAAEVAKVALIILVVGLVLAAIVPRWWAHRLGDVIDGSLTMGTIVGLGLGFFCTLIPIAILVWGVNRRNEQGKMVTAAILALVFAFPNLATLWISIGGGGGASAGRQTLEVEAPFVRMGTLLGALAAFALCGWFYWRQRQKAQKQDEQVQPVAA